MQAKLVLADLGFCCMNIVDSPCGVGSWARVNTRPLGRNGVQDLFHKFNSVGPLKCQADKVIFVPMRPTWFKNKTVKVINGQYISDIPVLELTLEGTQAIADDKFHPLNGNHRRAALGMYCKKLEAELAALLLEVEDLKGEDEVAKLKEITVMEHRVKWAPYWTIQVYDIGACWGKY